MTLFYTLYCFGYHKNIFCLPWFFTKQSEIVTSLQHSTNLLTTEKNASSNTGQRLSLLQIKALANKLYVSCNITSLDLRLKKNNTVSRKENVCAFLDYTLIILATGDNNDRTAAASVKAIRRGQHLEVDTARENNNRVPRVKTGKKKLSAHIRHFCYVQTIRTTKVTTVVVIIMWQSHTHSPCDERTKMAFERMEGWADGMRG